jgi:REP-associated tyrosine transposase
MAMTYDPNVHHRRSIRMPGYDYARPGAYFVTLCTQGGECLFDDPVIRRVAEALWQELPRHFPGLSLDAWVVMPNHFHGIAILADAHDVGAMHSYTRLPLTKRLPPGDAPDATKGLPGNASPLRLSAMGMAPGAMHSDQVPPPTTGLPPEETPDAATYLSGNASPLPVPSGAARRSLGAIVGNYKSITARRINRIRGAPGMPVWQRNYWEHVIRNEAEMQRIRGYIQTNPARWSDDLLHPDARPNRFNQD